MYTIFICGTNLRIEEPLLYFKVRNALSNKNINLISIGKQVALDALDLGCSLDFFFQVILGKHKASRLLYKSGASLVILGKAFLNVINSNITDVLSILRSNFDSRYFSKETAHFARKIDVIPLSFRFNNN